jgi:acyl-CoA dehydrogenase
VKTTPDGGHHGLSFFVIEKGMDGFSVSRKLEKLGWHASDTAELAFNDVFVPDENLLGQENKGFYLIMANFQWERLGMALGATAKQQDLLERALAYVNERSAFGRAIGHFQVTRHKIAEIALRAEAGRAITYNALRLFVNGHDALRETTMAKLVTQRDCVRTADDVVQLFGGNGYMREYEVERALRDARLGPIGGGSDEIMKEILGRQLGL